MIDWTQVKTAEQKQSEAEQQAKENTNEEARAYLNSTDWYVVRFAETGVAIPQEILDARQAARERIV